MYFKKLELIGFKSFAEKTVLHFEPGITAVVGPNGCGKSNVFDSIRWVLGEQSAKSLRGSDMQDVIFNGTDSKEPVGMAEVTLAFDNSSRFFNLDHDEVAVTRRLFRSGESEYLLNKSLVRLKDILDLLLGTGIGAESYSIVAQGHIDLVLSSRPEDRRLVFDEASGITKYKSQKRETMRRLEETEQNLLRINDIITEVKRQISSLERQANKARKYKECFEELKGKEVSLAVLQKIELLRQKEEIAGQIKELGIKEMELFNLVKEQEAKIANRQQELRSLEEAIMAARNKALNLENTFVRNKEHITFNNDRLLELAKAGEYLTQQIEESKNKLISDQEKLYSLRQEFSGIQGNIEIKSRAIAESQARIDELASAIKGSLDVITKSKKDILDLAAKLAVAKNEISDHNAREQVFLARKKRLELERAKVNEEKASIEERADSAGKEVEILEAGLLEVNQKISSLKNETEKEALSLAGINSEIESLGRQRLSLESHKEFLEKLKTKYEDISESMRAVVFLDRLPAEKVSGLVVKITNDSDNENTAGAGIKLSGEAKPIELDTRKICARICEIETQIASLREQKALKEKYIGQLNQGFRVLGEELRAGEINLANKQAGFSAICAELEKAKEEEDVISLELDDVAKELSALIEKIASSSERLWQLDNQQKQAQEIILQEENNVSLNSRLREETLVIITQARAESDALRGRLETDARTLKILQDTYQQDKDSLSNFQSQSKDIESKETALNQEISSCHLKISELSQEIQKENTLLKETEAQYRQVQGGSGDAIRKIEADRAELDSLKNKVYELQMQEKDTDYKYSGIKMRMQEAYKADLEAMLKPDEGVEPGILTQEIETLKNKLDSYGTVNLVAIEEYDELKKRYDFLLQQQGDLVSAKDSLHEAILKINRTTKQMFLETFDKVKEEFRNYFRLLFNGGDAQLFLIDEHDPLESGIEIICRPPGKKLQNVLLLSGGEKALSAIALIFSIFKVKPSPFCILDEIDAALDEANVDRFSRLLKDFSKTSQFIVITHNKKTIANASVMYGITMERSGESKIVSVKFARDAQMQDKGNLGDGSIFYHSVNQKK